MDRNEARSGGALPDSKDSEALGSETVVISLAEYERLTAVDRNVHYSFCDSCGGRGLEGAGVHSADFQRWLKEHDEKVIAGYQHSVDVAQSVYGLGIEEFREEIRKRRGEKSLEQK